MKGKIAIGLCLSAICADAIGADELANAYFDICRTVGDVVLVLHKDVDANSVVLDGNQWTVELPYDILSGTDAGSVGTKNSTLTGIAACSTINTKSNPDGSSYTCDGCSPVREGDVNTFAIMTDASAGDKCWCRLTGPITSYWTFVHQYSSDKDCADNCPTYCANGFAKNTPMMDGGGSIRGAIIDGVW
ncbi:MAG: hypothetical protein R8N24_04755 [Alphaproteobacteria bacterium]|nr:hypothetical protein [Alphaproteobacteria bacterium]